jgi:hypothetical protein
MLDFGGRPVVEVMLDGKGPYRFIFDTGAAFNVIDSSLGAELGLEDSATLDEVRLAKVALHDVEAVVMPISKMLGTGDVPRGVLSASALPGALVVFDYPGRRIAFRKGALGEPDGKTVFNYDPGDLPSIPVNVAGREFVVYLDTGAPYPLALPTKYMKELPLAAPSVQKGKVKSHVGMLPLFVASLKGDIAIGDLRVATRELHFTDVVLHPEAEPKGQVGDEALREFVLTLDSANHRIELRKK